MTITCPNCGRPVPPNQNYCGNCGTEVRAVPPPHPIVAPAVTPVTIAAADPQPPADYYGYEENQLQTPGGRRPSTAILVLIIAAIAIVCLCCGLVFGLFIPQVWYWIGPVPATPTPAPSGMILLPLYG